MKIILVRTLSGLEDRIKTDLTTEELSNILNNLDNKKFVTFNDKISDKTYTYSTEQIEKIDSYDLSDEIIHSQWNDPLDTPPPEDSLLLVYITDIDDYKILRTDENGKWITDLNITKFAWRYIPTIR